MTATCKNRQNHFHGNFCNTCGQSANTHRISLRYLWHDIQPGLFHFDKGILYTAAQLLRRPGNAIREFIEGKRMRMSGPISLVLILAGLYGFLAGYFHINMLAGTVKVQSSSAAQQAAFQSALDHTGVWLAEHYAPVSLAQSPIFSLSTFIAFRKQGYNFAEHFVLNAFLAAQRILLRLILFPLYFELSGTEAITIADRIVSFVGTVLMVFTLMQFFNHQKKLSVFFRSLLGLLIYLVIIAAIMAFLVYLLEKKIVKRFG